MTPVPAVHPVARRGGIGLYEWNPTTLELHVDDTLARLFDAREGETPLQTWRRLVHPDDQKRMRETFAQVGEAEALCRLVMDDGSLRYLLVRATRVVPEEDGRPSKVLGVVVDVTTVHEAGARIQRMLESISDGFFALDADFRLTYVNQRAEQLLGLRREELVGRVLFEAFPHAVGTPLESVPRRVMRSRQPETFEEYYPEPFEMWVEVKAHPSDDGIVLYFQDVTARRHEQEEKERLLAAEQSARAEAESAWAEADRARQAAEEVGAQLAHAASHDHLTRLLNRWELERQLQLRLAAGDDVTLLFLDLDRFKLVNDSLGHAAGDALLVAVADRLRPLVRHDDVVARIGGDEFVLMLAGPDTEGAQEVAERVLAAVRAPIRLRGRTVTSSASIGLATSGSDTTVESLLRDADVALYRAKDAGRDRLAWFDAHAHGQLLERVRLEADLRSAVDTGSVVLHYQPLFDAATLRPLGVEGLARWTHPVRGAVPPSSFVPLAEDAGLIATLGGQLFGQACAQAARWAHLPDFTVWVNVSGRQLETPGLARRLLAQAEAAGVPPHRLGVEVTESVLMDERAAHRELSAMAEAGISVAIDDFGTGFSSLSRLTTLPIDVLKIDQSFVSRMSTVRGRETVAGVVHLAHALGKTALAEGVETPEQLELLRAAGCDAVSGFLLARPAPADELDLSASGHRPRLATVPARRPAAAS